MDLWLAAFMAVVSFGGGVAACYLFRQVVARWCRTCGQAVGYLCTECVDRRRAGRGERHGTRMGRVS